MCVCITAHTWNSEDNLEGSPPSSHHVHLGESALAEVSLPRVPAQGVGLSTAWSGARIAGWSSRDTSLWRPQTPHRTLQFRVPFAPKLPRMAVVERALGVVGHRPSLLLPHPPRPASTLVLWVAWVGDRGRAHSHPCSGVSSLSQGHGARSPFFPVHSSRSSTRQPRSRNAALATSSQSGWAARACKMSSSAPKSRMGLEKTWLRDTRFRISMQACFWKTERM